MQQADGLEAGGLLCTLLACRVCGGGCGGGEREGVSDTKCEAGGLLGMLLACVCVDEGMGGRGRGGDKLM